MAKKNYTEDFRRQAVDLLESTPGATVKGIADDLGVSRGSLREWANRYGNPTAAGTAVNTLGNASRAGRIARLETELAASRAEAVKLRTERDMLRQAAKYFAGETNW